MSLHPLAHEMSQGKLSVVIQNVKQDKSHLGSHVLFFFFNQAPFTWGEGQTDILACY